MARKPPAFNLESYFSNRAGVAFQFLGLNIFSLRVPKVEVPVSTRRSKLLRAAAEAHADDGVVVTLQTSVEFRLSL